MDEREKFKKKYEEAVAKQRHASLNPECEEIRRDAFLHTYRGSDALKRRLIKKYHTQDVPPLPQPTPQDTEDRDSVKTYEYGGVLVLLFGLFFIGVAGFLGCVGAAIALQYYGWPSGTAWLLACLCVVLSVASMNAVVYYGNESMK
jgi:hypothetical protein